MESNAIKSEELNFRLPFVAHERLCLSSLLLLLSVGVCLPNGSVMVTQTVLTTQMNLTVLPVRCLHAEAVSSSVMMVRVYTSAGGVMASRTAVITQMRRIVPPPSLLSATPTNSDVTQASVS